MEIKKNIDFSEVASDPSLKGKRVRSARMLTGLTRKKFEEKYKIHENTLKSWESPKQSQQGLTEKGAKRLIEALKNESINCTVEWLMTGAGHGPKLTNTHSVYSKKSRSGKF